MPGLFVSSPYTAMICPSTACTYYQLQEYSVATLKSLHAEMDDIEGGIADMWDLCVVFAYISEFSWCAAVLGQCDICPTLVSLLTYAPLSLNVRPKSSFICSFTQSRLLGARSWAACDILRTLRNLSVRGGNGGRQAVLDATTDDLRRILPRIGDSVRCFGVDTLAFLTRTQS